MYNTSGDDVLPLPGCGIQEETMSIAVICISAARMSEDRL
jgi:hypothetical protein